jgi:hypothetical protein
MLLGGQNNGGLWHNYVTEWQTVAACGIILSLGGQNSGDLWHNYVTEWQTVAASGIIMSLGGQNSGGLWHNYVTGCNCDKYYVYIFVTNRVRW